MRYLAVDYGLKRTGLAICDPDEIIASPLAVITGSENFIEEIVETIEEESAQAVVLGLPLNMDGSVGPQAELVQEFAEELKKHIEIPLYFQDERLSSFSAADKLSAMDFTRKKKAKRLDAIAAAEILTEFLEAKKQNP